MIQLRRHLFVKRSLKCLIKVIPPDYPDVVSFVFNWLLPGLVSKINVRCGCIPSETQSGVCSFEICHVFHDSTN